MSVFKTFFRVFTLFNKKEKRNSVVLFVMILLGAMAETLSVSAVLPLMTVMLEPTVVEKNAILRWIIELPFVGTYTRLVVFLCAALIAVFVAKSAYVFLLLYYQNRFALNRQISLSRRLFTSYVNKPYPFFFERNSAELLRNINGFIPGVITGILMPGLSLITELLVVGLIFVLLIWTDLISALVVAALLGGIGGVFYAKIKTKLEHMAAQQNLYSKNMNQSVVEGINSIKEIKVLCKENAFVREYGRNSDGYAKVQSFYNLASQAPRLMIEALAVCGIVVVVLVSMLVGRDVGEILPTLSLFAVAAIRIMPSMNRVLGYITSIRFSGVLLNEIYDDLMEASADWGQEAGCSKNVFGSFAKEIRVDDLTYRYPKAESDVLQSANLVIRAGESIGLMGSSGAGKSTLVDIILGLLEPTEGRVLVDGIDIREDMSGWRKNLGYVPQSIYLIDNSIRRNVAFGLREDQIDDKRVWAALEGAQMKEFVESLPNQLDTVVGEAGTRLSGGQRQRIGIARALYHDPKILVFDEATSALDTEVEKLITEAIDNIGKSKTMIIIAHRLNTLEKCDRIYKVENGKIIETVKSL